MTLIRHLPAMSIAVGLIVGPALSAAAAQPEAEQQEQPLPIQEQAQHEEQVEQPNGEALLLNGQLTQAQEWVDKPIHDQQGQEIGHLRDFAVDVTNGRLAYAIISLEQAQQQQPQPQQELGQQAQQQEVQQPGAQAQRQDLGDGLYAVPWEAFEPSPQEEALTLQVGLEQFDPEQSFEEGDLPDMTDEQWAQQTHEQYGYQVYWEERAQQHEGQQLQEHGQQEQPQELGQQEQPQEQVQAREQAQIGQQQEMAQRDQAPEHVEPLDELIGREINDPADESLAQLDDLVIDLREGRIPYAVLSYGGILGFGEDLVAVPWQALDFDAEQEVFVLDATEDMLDQFAFDEDQWPDMTDEQWAQQVHTEFGQEPYWEVYGYAAPGEEEPAIEQPEEIEQPEMQREAEEPGVQQIEQTLQQSMEQAGVDTEQAQQEARRLAEQFQQERPDEQAIADEIQQALEQAGTDAQQAEQAAQEAAPQVSQQLDELAEEPDEVDPFEPAQPEQEREEHEDAY